MVGTINIECHLNIPKNQHYLDFSFLGRIQAENIFKTYNPSLFFFENILFSFENYLKRFFFKKFSRINENSMKNHQSPLKLTKAKYKS